jgi:hypothetical protein
MNRFFVAAAVLLVSSASQAALGQNEGAIRQADQNLVLKGQVNQELKFSVTGQLTDRCRVFLPNGALFADQTLAQLRTSPFCESSFQNSGGNWTLRLRFVANPAFNAGRVELRRQGTGVIDSDPIRLR